MAETAAHLVDHVIPHMPVRQWVLSFPKRLRPFLHHRPRTASAVLPILLRALQATLREALPHGSSKCLVRGAPRTTHWAARLHYHLCVVDGLFEKIEGDTAQDSAHPQTSLRFHEPTALTPQLLERLQHTIRSRVPRHCRRHSLLEFHDAQDMLAWNHGGGFSLDASVRIEATDREGLDRLIR